MNFRSNALACAALIALAAPLNGQDFDRFIAVQPGTVALTNAKVIDGTGAPAMDNQTILIEGDRITAIGPSGSVRVPADAEVHDLTGQTVIPGLVGMHNHSYYTGGNGRAAQLSFSGSRLYLASGVTTIIERPVGSPSGAGATPKCTPCAALSAAKTWPRW